MYAQKLIAEFYRPIHVHFRTGIERNITGWFISSGYPFITMTSSNRNIFRVTALCVGNPPVTGGLHTKTSDAKRWWFFSSAPKQTLSKQSIRRWFETPWHSVYTATCDIAIRWSAYVSSLNANKFENYFHITPKSFTIRVNLMYLQ